MASGEDNFLTRRVYEGSADDRGKEKRQEALHRSEVVSATSEKGSVTRLQENVRGGCLLLLVNNPSVMEEGEKA